MTKIAKFAQDYDDAMYEAENAVCNMRDYGTCNFDMLMVKLPHMAAKQIIKIAKEHHVTAWKNKEGYWDMGRLWGQGMRNTKAQEVMCDYLKSKGYACYVKYLMD